MQKVKEEKKKKQPRKITNFVYLGAIPRKKGKRKEKISRVENKTLIMSCQMGFAVPHGKNIENEKGPIMFVTHWRCFLQEILDLDFSLGRALELSITSKFVRVEKQLSKNIEMKTENYWLATIISSIKIILNPYFVIKSRLELRKFFSLNFVCFYLEMF